MSTVRQEDYAGHKFSVIREEISVPFVCTRCTELSPKKAEKKAKGRVEWVDTEGRKHLLCLGCYGTVLERLRHGEDPHKGSQHS